MMASRKQLETGRRTPLIVLGRALVVLVGTASLGGCYTTRSADISESTPSDYRQRHPITLTEKPQTLEVFVGTGRGGLTPTQRAQVLAFAGSWRREGTAGLIIDQPIHSPNARAAGETLHEVRAILAASGVLGRGMVVRGYDGGTSPVAPIRISYPRVAAQAGPCGLWPQSIGPSYDSGDMSNKPYWNFGCASQRNLASMVADPVDLVQPRAETSASAPRRNAVLDKYRKGDTTSSPDPAGDKAKISDLGK
jgi:pilus assembly protein CpaD